MKHYELKPLNNSNIPPTIQTLTAQLSNYIILKDGHIIVRQLDESLQPIFVDSYEHSLPDKINVFFDTEFVNQNEASDAVYAYNVDHVNSGLLIHVPKNVALATPIHVFYLQEGHPLVHNTRIVLEPNSELKYFEYLYSETADSVSFVSNSVIKENAQLEYAGISNLNNITQADIRRNSFVFRYGRSHYSLAEVNDGNTSSVTNMYLQEKYAEATSKTVAITSEAQSASYKQMIEHNAPETEGYIENYGVSNHASSLVFEGVGKINKNMKRSIARQSNRGIVLGVDSRLDANPLLLIDEFDVEASHGAAIGKIDEDQLYYLMSRGLTLRVAERLIISGFLSPILEILSTDDLRVNFIQKVEHKTS